MAQVCEGILPNGGWSCGCGYNPQTPTQEVAIERLLVRRRKIPRLIVGAGLVAGLFFLTLWLSMSGVMDVFGYLLVLFNGGLAGFIAVVARRERATIERQLAVARSFGQLPPARVVK